MRKPYHFFLHPGLKPMVDAACRNTLRDGGIHYQSMLKISRPAFEALALGPAERAAVQAARKRLGARDLFSEIPVHTLQALAC